MKKSRGAARDLYRLRLFTAVVCHALPHRRLAAWTAAKLAEFALYRQRLGKAAAFFTHCFLAKLRHVLHRNTTRDIIRELEEMGFIKKWSYRPGLANRFIINWGYVFYWAKSRDVSPMTVNDSDFAQAAPVRTKAQWDAERAAYHAARKAEADAARKADADAKAARDAQAAQEFTPEKRAARASFARELGIKAGIIRPTLSPEALQQPITSGSDALQKLREQFNAIKSQLS